MLSGSFWFIIHLAVLHPFGGLIEALGEMIRNDVIVVGVEKEDGSANEPHVNVRLEMKVDAIESPEKHGFEVRQTTERLGELVLANLTEEKVKLKGLANLAY